MGIYENITRGISSLTHPSSEGSKSLRISESLLIYYPIALISLILAIIVNYAYRSYSGATTYMHGFVAMHPIALAIVYLVAIPIGIFIDAAIYQLVGKYFLNAFKGAYSKTFAAYTFAIMPFLALYWIAQIPILIIPLDMLIAIWSMVILVIAIAAQHKIKRTDAVITVITAFALMCIIACFVFFGLALSSLPLIAGHYGAGAMVP